MAAMRRMFTAGMIGALVAAAPARADIIAQSAQGFVSRNAVIVAATPAQVWKRLITPAVWWSSDHTFSGDAANMSLDPVAGGCFCERLPGEPVKGAKPGTHAPALGGVEHMRVVNVERDKALRMIGALGPLQSEAVNATLTVTLKPMDGGTRIVFEYVVGGYMRYPAEKIQPAVDTVMANQLLSLAHGFAPGSASQSLQPEPAAQSGPVSQSGEAAGPADAPAPSRGLDKNGLLLPRGRIWSLPPSDGAPAPESAPAALPPAPVEPAVAPLQAAAIPPDVTASGGAGARTTRAKPLTAKPAPAADDAPLVDVPPPAATRAPAVAKKSGKAGRKTPAKPVTPQTPPKSDEPSTDAVNSVVDGALSDPQRPVSTTPN